MTFPSSSFRGLIVTATAFEIGESENCRLNWMLGLDGRDVLMD